MNAPYILWTEDDPDDEQLILLALSQGRFDGIVVFARDGVEALDRLARAGRDGERGLPAVVVLDLKLPRIDGFEVLQRVRADERTRAIPVVVFSSSHRPEDVRRCGGLGANSYVRKPIDYAEFSAVVQRLARYWLRDNETPPAT